MKYIKTYLAIFSFVLLNNCSDFLEVDQIGKSTIPVFFSDIEGFRSALPGAYSRVYDYYGEEFVLYPDVAADMIQVNTAGENSMISQYNYISNPDEELTAVGGIWTDALEALVNVNNMIEYGPAVVTEYPETEEEMSQIRANALFLRALIHFDLVRVYAQSYNYTDDASHIGIPVLLKTPSSDDNVTRNSVAEVYTQVIKDLKDAELLFDGLTNTESTYYASNKAVYGLLARVYLYMENWTEAANYATLAINTTPLSQGQDYLDMFFEVDGNDESLFKLNGYLKTPELIDFYNLSSPYGYAGDKLMTLLNENPDDIRLELLSSGELGTLKYLKNNVDISVRGYDIIVLRTSEMYLIRAEANNNLNNLDDAIADLKTLRARNYQEDVNSISILEDTKEAVAALIDNERAREFCFEGHRLYDITRTKQDMIRAENTTSNVKEVLYPSSLFVLPIPQKEIDVNTGMIQNEDYN